jgi:hypothetical protein
MVGAAILADKPVQAPYLAQLGSVLCRCRITPGHNAFTARPYLRNKNFLQINDMGNLVLKVKKWGSYLFTKRK